MRFALFLTLILAFVTAYSAPPLRVDRVVVDKSARTLSLMSGKRTVARFPVALGGNPMGHKQHEGDRRTPEGSYVLDYKKADSAFFKAIHVSYPNAMDKKNARRLEKNPGGAIMIHGQKNGLGRLSLLTQRYDWTNGCIALSNEDMQMVWDRVRVPVPIEISP